VIRENAAITPVWGDRTSSDGIVKFTREVWMTDRAAAASIGIATQGRFFGEAVASGVLGPFPLMIGEAPERLNLAFRANSRITVRAGLTSGYHFAHRHFSVSRCSAITDSRVPSNLRVEIAPPTSPTARCNHLSQALTRSRPMAAPPGQSMVP